MTLLHALPLLAFPPSSPLPPQGAAELPVVVLEADDLVVTESCRLEIAAAPILDADGDGVVHVAGDDVVLDFGGARLVGSAEGTAPDAVRGIAVRVTGTGVTVRNARLSGFHCAIFATGADDLTVERCEVGDGFRQRLASTPTAEAPEDWLRPHENDGNEWLERYGAAVYVEDSSGVAVHDVVVRRVQNGILFDRVESSAVYDNDCSFLSGWGIALWRSSSNRILKNAVDFCVRGYSHGVYNRGQDSAGILLFEQSSENVVAENSATHCGDGVFLFAGTEALGQDPPVDPPVDAPVDAPVDVDAEPAPPGEDFYERRGSNRNVFHHNDLSFSVAHGLEATFSFGNLIHTNRFDGNAICGIWGGYSQRLQIYLNRFTDNGRFGYGLERGAIDIEHGSRNVIAHNHFLDNACGVHIWCDHDPELESTPWALANGTDCTRNRIQKNEFEGDVVGIQLRDAPGNVAAENTFSGVGQDVVFTPEESRPGLRVPIGFMPPPPPEYEDLGRTRPVGQRDHLRGLQHIVMTEWGPYDFSEPLLRLQSRSAEGDEFLLYMPAMDWTAELVGDVELDEERRSDPDRLTVQPARGGELIPYTLRVESGDRALEHRGAIAASPWLVWSFAWETDPREDLDAWHAEAEADHVTMTVPALDLPFGFRGPGGTALAPEDVRRADLPADRFGTIATSKLRVPAGRWRLRTRSDDGIRVWADRELLIDDWTHHGPTEHTVVLDLPEARSVDLRVEHFELDGFATLELVIEEE